MDCLPLKTKKQTKRIRSFIFWENLRQATLPLVLSDLFQNITFYLLDYFTGSQGPSTIYFKVLGTRNLEYEIRICIKFICTKAESTKQMEQTLRAKVEIVFKSENLNKCFY